jgi:hypothetical protein
MCRPASASASSFRGRSIGSVGPPQTASGVPGADSPPTAHWPQATSCRLPQNPAPRTRLATCHVPQATCCAWGPAAGRLPNPEPRTPIPPPYATDHKLLATSHVPPDPRGRSLVPRSPACGVAHGRFELIRWRPRHGLVPFMDTKSEDLPPWSRQALTDIPCRDRLV